MPRFVSIWVKAMQRRELAGIDVQHGNRITFL
jgi:hypothetical protein